MSSTLQGAVVLVTGANRGIGKAIVEEALARGASKVYAAVRRPELAGELEESSGGKVVAIRIDLDDAQSIQDAAKQASDVQVVVHNAGIAETDSVLSPTALETLHRQIDVNVGGLIRMAQAFAPVLKANGGGAFAQLNSVVSVKTFGSVGTYSASKAAAYSVTQALREELASQGTHVVSVHPGPIATDMAKEAGFYERAESPSVVAQALLTAVEQKAFHVFPDSVARQIGAAYGSFAENVIEAPAELPAGVH
jgi:NAD(P)-dependent dehydrogenase (short-subunit alcohol dehydrogenase family)